MDAFADLYHKRAPRWFKVIRWREWGQRFYTNQVLALQIVYIPIALYYISFNPDRLATKLFFKRPRTQEELDAVRREARFTAQGGMPLNAVRNYEIGQYRMDMPPFYDLAVRRKAYPEHYGDRYDKFVR